MEISDERMSEIRKSRKPSSDMGSGSARGEWSSGRDSTRKTQGAVDLVTVISNFFPRAIQDGTTKQKSFKFDNAKIYSQLTWRFKEKRRYALGYVVNGVAK